MTECGCDGCYYSTQCRSECGCDYYTPMSEDLLIDELIELGRQEFLAVWPIYALEYEG